VLCLISNIFPKTIFSSVLSVASSAATRNTFPLTRKSLA
jgi:hypothetical protein